MRKTILLLPLVLFLAGCPVTQPQDTPVDAQKLTVRTSDDDYWVYVSSNYTASRSWPVVITLHGTPGFDGAKAQIRAWKALAEKHGFIVAAPELSSVQGILPVLQNSRQNALRKDDTTILAVLDDLGRKYNINRDNVLLTGFSAGGYPLYYTGLSHPERFSALVARACNFDKDTIDHIPITDETRSKPILIFWGKDDFREIRRDGWAAFRYLRLRYCRGTEKKEIDGGHTRRPGVAARWWLDQTR
ncbi:MAG: alpha/beta hydrolase-fold protein [Phycisphaerae bacterium]